MIDFKSLNSYLCSQAITWLPQILPGGKFKGTEYVCAGIEGGKGESFSVRITDGVWKEFAGGPGGADLITLYAKIHGIGNAEAARRLGAEDRPRAGGYTNGHAHLNDSSAPTPVAAPTPAVDPPKAAAPMGDATKPPDDAPLGIEAFRHYELGDASARWVYRDAAGDPLMVIARYETDDGKELRPWTWRGGRWISKGPPKPKPLYGLDRLAAISGDVLVVEGEKTADAALFHFPSHAIVTWQSGSNAAIHADWTPLAGRTVTIWPDHDASGREAAIAIAGILVRLDCDVSIVDTSEGGWPEGWDLADSAGGVNIAAYMASHAVRVGVTTDLADAIEDRQSASDPTATRLPDEGDSDAATYPPDSTESIPYGTDSDSGGDLALESIPDTEPPRVTRLQTVSTGAVVDQFEPGSLMELWMHYGFHLKSNGKPYCNEYNATCAIMSRRPAMQLYLDEFQQRVIWGDGKEWTDNDTLSLTKWIQDELEIREMRTSTVKNGVATYAYEHKINPVRDWMKGLKWDGVSRLKDMLPLAFGTARNAYTEAVGRCFMVGMVARVLEPGCQVDAMPVFEGSQGNGKTSALRIIGGEFFAEVHDSIMSKDFLVTLAGKMLCEISELGAFRTADIERIKGIITDNRDRYRAPYASTATDHPRQCVFSGTTNRDDWNTDMTGARRFWPVACGEIDLEWLRENREQLFAEAVERKLDGEPWWDVPHTDAEEQRRLRRETDAWDQRIEDFLKIRDTVRIAEIMELALDLKPHQMDRLAQTRIIGILRRMGYEKSMADGNVREWRRKAAP